MTPRTASSIVALLWSLVALAAAGGCSSKGSPAAPGSGGAGGGGGAAGLDGGRGGAGTGGAGAGGTGGVPADAAISDAGAPDSGASAGRDGPAPDGGDSSGRIWQPARTIDSNAGGALTMIDDGGNGMVVTWHASSLYATAFSASETAAGGWKAIQPLFACGACTSVRGDMNGHGVGALAWAENTVGAPPTFGVVARRYASGAWETPPTTWSVGNADAVEAVVVAPSDTVHLFSGASVTDTTAGPTGAWSSRVSINAPGIVGAAFFAPASFAAFDSTGDGVAVTAGGSQPVGYRYGASAPGWSGGDLLAGTETSSTALVAADAQGGAMALIAQPFQILTARYSKQGGWAPGAGGTIQPPVMGQIGPLATTSDGTGFFALWLQMTSPASVYASRFDGTSWSAPARISDVAQPALVGHPVIRTDAHRNAIALWLEGSIGSATVVSARYDAGTGTWSTPAKLSATPALVADTLGLAVSADGAALAAWMDSSGTVSATALR